MLFSPVSIFLGLANLVYTGLNLRLLVGLGNLANSANSEKSVKAVKAENLPAVTILIAARNEALRITKCLQCLFAQEYPPELLQIIIVNDRSTDATPKILADFSEQFPGRLTLLHISKDTTGYDPKNSPKKFALRCGLEKATGEIMITTDADCIMTKNWVKKLVSEFSEDTGLVLGMTSYYGIDNSDRIAGKNTGFGKPLKNLIAGTEALEFISYGIVAAALVGLKFPVHGNANNIAYRRKVYHEAAGFSSHSHIISGDDDFLIQSVHKLGKWKIKYAVTPESQVQTEPPLSLKQFWEQRKRWASKCSLYEPKQTLFLMTIFIYYALIPISLLLGLWNLKFFWIGLGSWVIKTTTDYLVMHKGLGLFGKKDLLRWFIPTSIVYIPIILAAVLAGTFGGFTWKDQRVGRKG